MASPEMLWQQYPLCAVVPFSCNTVQSYLSSPLFHHRQFLDQASLHVLEHDTEDYLSGRKKQELTDWWLQYIEDRVEKYLEEKGYDPACVPFQYLDHPPTSMKRLQENIHVVRAVLSELNIRNSSTQATQTEYELVIPLKQQVYYKVEILRKNLKLVLWDQLNNYGIRVEYHLINDCRDMGFVEQIYLLLEKGVQRVGIPNNIKKGLQELIDDILYINEVRKLDENFFYIQHPYNNKPADIVPITGLILNRIHRIDNELRTVYEHWKGRIHN